jgi:hypothetical protein
VLKFSNSVNRREKHQPKTLPSAPHLPASVSFLGLFVALAVRRSGRFVWKGQGRHPLASGSVSPLQRFDVSQFFICVVPRFRRAKFLSATRLCFYFFSFPSPLQASQPETFHHPMTKTSIQSIFSSFAVVLMLRAVCRKNPF